MSFLNSKMYEPSVKLMMFVGDLKWSCINDHYIMSFEIFRRLHHTYIISLLPTYFEATPTYNLPRGVSFTECSLLKVLL